MMKSFVNNAILMLITLQYLKDTKMERTHLRKTLIKNTAEDWAYGWNVGGLYQFTPQTRVGLSFHSQVVHHPDGTSSATNPSLTTAESSASTDLVIPPYTMLSGYHAFNNHWAVMGTIVYTDWQQIQQITDLHQNLGIRKSATADPVSGL